VDSEGPCQRFTDSVERRVPRGIIRERMIPKKKWIEPETLMAFPGNTGALFAAAIRVSCRQ